MWKHRSDKHCSDDLLLAHADGESRGLARLRTAAHLRRCWECRARLSELEHEAEALARLMKQQAARHAGHTASARDAFLVWKRGFEAGLPEAGPRRRQALRWPLAAAAAACGVAVLVLWPRAERVPAQPTAADVLRGVAAFHDQLHTRPGTLHQVLRVEVSQSRPARRRSAGRLEIWSDRAGGRYASRWVDQHQGLKYAVWRQPGKAPVVYAAASRQAAGTWFDPHAEELTVEGLERSFFEWFMSRGWQAAPDFSEAVAQDGTRMSLERLPAGGWRVRAWRAGRTVRAEFSIDVDAGSYHPRLQVMRLETAERTLELRVAADRLEVVAVASAAVFEPDVPRSAVAAVPPPPARPAPPAPPAPEAGEIETEVLWAVHRAGACGNLQVSAAPDGAIEVRAIVESAARRAEVVEALRQAGGGRVRAEVQVVERTRPGPERSHPLLHGEGLRIIDHLYLESLALMRLAERYAPGRAGALTPRQQELVSAMVRDHAAALRAGSRAARTQVEPALAPVAGSRPAAPADAPKAADWAAAAAGIFRALDHADNLTDVPPGPETESRRQEAAAAVLAALAEVEQRIAELDGLAAPGRR